MAKRPAPDAAPWASHGCSAGLALAVCVAPLAVLPGLGAAYTLPKLLVLSLSALLCAAAALLAPSPDARPFRPTPLDLPWAAVAAAALASAAVAADGRLALFGRYNYSAHGLWGLGLCAVLFHFAAWTPPSRARPILLAAAAGGGLVGAYAVLQKLGIDPVFPGVASIGGRPVSTIGGPPYLGSHLALLLPLCLHLALAGSGAWAWAALAAVAGGLAAAASAGSLLAAAAGTAVYALMSRRLRLPRWTRAGWALAGLALFVLLAGAAYLLSRRQLGASALARVEIWRVAWQAFLARPWLGWGPDNFEIAFRVHAGEGFYRSTSQSYFTGHAHNELLNVLACTGLAGGLAGAWWLAALSSRAVRAAADPARPWAAGAAAGLAAFFLNLQLNPGSLPSLALAAVLAGLLAGGTDQEPVPAGRRVLGWAALAFAAASLFWAAGLSNASRRFYQAKGREGAGDARAALAFYQQALAADPCELTYHENYINFLFKAANTTRDRRDAEALVAEAGRLGALSVRCHPRHFLSHFVRGFAWLLDGSLRRDAARVAEAGAELDAALALNPYFVPLLFVREVAAREAGDHALAGALRERGGRLSRAAGQGAGP